MEKRTTWQSSWPAYATGHGASTGTSSLPCLSMTPQQKEPTHSLRPSILGRHQGTRGHLREHADQGRARQRYVLLLLVRLAHERVPRNSTPIR